MIRWKTLKKYLPVIGILLFLYILIRLDISSILVAVSKANLLYLLIALFLVLIFFIFQTLKWHVIARKQKIKVPFWDSFKIDIISNYYGFITPSKIGTVSRAGYLKKYAGGLGKGISNFVLDKILDLTSLAFLALVFFSVFREKLGVLSIWYFVAMFLVFVFMLIMISNKKWMKFFARIVYRKFVPKKSGKKARGAFESFYKDMPSKTFLSGVFLINLLTWISIYTINYFVGLSLGISIPYVYFLAVLPITTLVAQIPITISGLGTREATMIGLFGLFSVDPVKIFSMSLLSILITNIIPAIFAIFMTLKEK